MGAGGASEVAAPYARIASGSVLLGACLGAFLGIAQTVQYGWGLGRFGGYEYVPRVVAVSTVRALGSGAALLVTAVSAAIVLHRAGRRASPRATVVGRRDRTMAWIGAGTLGAFVLVCVLTGLAGAGTMAALFGVRATAFLASAWGSIMREDLGRGLGLTAVDAALAIALVPLASGWLAAPRRSLVLKLFVAYAAVQGVAIAEQTALALLGG